MPVELPLNRKVFISYVAEDSQIAHEIAAGLESRGYSTWYYQRDCPIGADYFEETFKAITRCEAMLLVISRQTLGSEQITREVVRAAETTKRFLPLLVGLTNEEYQQRRPGWKQAMGAANAVPIPPQGVGAILPDIVEGLKTKRIQPDGVPCAASTGPAPLPPQPAVASKRIVLLYKRSAHPDEDLLKFLEQQLTERGHQVFIDRHMQPGVEWLLEIQRQVCSADAVIPLLSSVSINSEMLDAEVKTAHEAAQNQNGKPYLVPVRLKLEGLLPEPLGPILNPIQYALWEGPHDNQKLVAEICAALQNPPRRKVRMIEPAGGAVPLDSEFYIVRLTDRLFAEAIERRDSIVLVKGARQMGKTSLLARRLRDAGEAGAKVVFTDFQSLNAEDLHTTETFYRALAVSIADQLGLEYFPEKVWRPGRSPNSNFQGFIRDQVLGSFSESLVWGMDEVDRLFTCSFAGDVFALLRSWHNIRAVDFKGPWKRFSLAIAYATEARLFITDPNMSPFNVGTRLELSDFTLDQVAELNRRYENPLRNADEIRRFYQVIGGNPYLVRRGLQELRTNGIGLSELEATAHRDEGPFGDHLRRILLLLAKDPALCDVVRQVMRGQTSIPEESFYRLRSAGVMAGESEREVQPRCQLYATYLKQHLL